MSRHLLPLIADCSEPEPIEDILRRHGEGLTEMLMPDAVAIIVIDGEDVNAAYRAREGGDLYDERASKFLDDLRDWLDSYFSD